MTLPDNDMGIAAAIVSGTIAAALAIPLARQKVRRAQPVLCVIGFFTPPALTLLAML